MALQVLLWTESCRLLIKSCLFEWMNFSSPFFLGVAKERKKGAFIARVTSRSSSWFCDSMAFSYHKFMSENLFLTEPEKCHCQQNPSTSRISNKLQCKDTQKNYHVLHNRSANCLTFSLSTQKKYHSRFCFSVIQNSFRKNYSNFICKEQAELWYWHTIRIHLENYFQ